MHIRRCENLFLEALYAGVFSFDDKGHVYRQFDEFRCRPVHRRVDIPGHGGYRRVYYRKNGTSHYCFVHRLICAYFQDIPDRMEINHKDGNKANNLRSNLEIVTSRQNTLHARDVLGTRDFSGSRNPNSKLDLRGVARIFYLRNRGYSYRRIGAAVGISQRQVLNILHRNSWKILR